MFDILWEEKLITTFIIVMFAISLLLQIILCRLYENMICEVDNMATTDHKLLKQCKLKFSNCYQLNNGVANIPIFVDKFLSRLAFGPISFEGIYHLSGQAMLLSIVGAGIGICKSIMAGRMLVDILPFYIVSLLGLYVYFSITSVMDIKGRKNTLKINLIDYLENHLSARISITEGDIAKLYGTNPEEKRKRHGNRRTLEYTPISNKMAEAAVDNTVPDKENAYSEPEKKATTFTGEQERELESLLKEFLTS